MINSISGNLGNGPDVLVYRMSHSLDYRVGSSSTGADHDDDLVVAGCGENPDGGFDIQTSTIHAGPGRDWVFIRDWVRAAIDLGNGADGRTDTIDPDDGDDFIDISGNTVDFRVFGGNGDDVAVWHVDDNVQTTTWLGPNFFGGGAAEGALWEDTGTDRLILDVPKETQIQEGGTTAAGAVSFRPPEEQGYRVDPGAIDDPFANYCLACGVSPEGRTSVTLEYRNAADTVFTGWFSVTAFEELQIGLGPGAMVYRIDDVAIDLVPAPDLEPMDPPSFPQEYCR